jgi:ATP-dependent DNA helicase RecQ
MAIDSTKFTIDNFDCFFYYQYFPVKYDGDATSEQLNIIRQIRKLVFNFKDGITGSEIGYEMGEDVYQYDLNQPRSSWYLCIIPASDPDKTRRRFKNFCESFCQKSNLNNGFNLICTNSERDELKKAIDRRNIDILSSISFGDVRNKRILLFDDVVTTGRSFSKIAERLIELGAIEVKGLFLARTFHLK